MIKAFIFDLDGTLVKTEILKARSYARAAVELCPDCATEEEIIEAYKSVVGLSRKEVAQALVERYGLERALKPKMKEFGVSTAWQAYVQVRMKIYDEMLADPATLREHLCPYNLDLLKWARQNGFKTGLATMSACEETNRVLESLGIRSEFDFIATADDITNGKPDPEVYLLVARQLRAEPSECLVIEDSATGVRAALAAGAWCIAVTSDFTRKGVRERGLLDKRWIIDNPAELRAAAIALIEEQKLSETAVRE